jgi:two-component system response regulator AtoC
MSFPLQAKLLQVLQDGEFSRLGGKNDVQVDVRVIAATNCNLETAVASGHFREDLYFRLNVVTINLPPLRERREEIPLLVDHFLKKYSVQYNKSAASVTQELHEQFMHYDWPGNVRQLENLIKRMVVLGTEAPIVRELQQPASPLLAFRQPSSSAPRPVMPPQPAVPPPAAAVPLPTSAAFASLPASSTGEPMAAAVGHGMNPAAPAGVAAGRVNGSGNGSSAATSLGAGNVSLKDIARTAAREAERELILRMLTRTRWNRKEAAEILGISYKALLYKIKENGLDKAS